MWYASLRSHLKWLIWPDPAMGCVITWIRSPYHLTSFYSVCSPAVYASVTGSSFFSTINFRSLCNCFTSASTFSNSNSRSVFALADANSKSVSDLADAYSFCLFALAFCFVRFFFSKQHFPVLLQWQMVQNAITQITTHAKTTARTMPKLESFELSPPPTYLQFLLTSPF